MNRRTNTVTHRAPSLIQTGHMMLLGAIALSVIPGVTIGGQAAGGIAIIGFVLYAVVALGGLYDLGRELAREVRQS